MQGDQQVTANHLVYSLHALEAKIAHQEATIAQQQKDIQNLMATVREQSAQIQKVSARLAAASLSSGELEAGNAVAQTAFNDR